MLVHPPLIETDICLHWSGLKPYSTNSHAVLDPHMDTYNATFFSINLVPKENIYEMEGRRKDRGNMIIEALNET